MYIKNKITPQETRVDVAVGPSSHSCVVKLGVSTIVIERVSSFYSFLTHVFSWFFLQQSEWLSSPLNKVFGLFLGVLWGLIQCLIIVALGVLSYISRLSISNQAIYTKNSSYPIREWLYFEGHIFIWGLYWIVN